jgi:signal transduction histidine kinase
MTGSIPEQPANARCRRLTSRLTVAGLALWTLVAGAGLAAGQPVPSTGAPPPPAARPAPDGAEKAHRVLLLYGEPRLTPAIVAVDAAIRSTIESRLRGPISFYTEYLDLNLFDGDVPQPELRALLRRKYATRPIDLIMAGGSRPLRVALHNRRDLFSSAPVVFVAVDPKAAADLRLEADVTGTWLHMGWTETVDLARRLQPGTRRAVVVGGTSPSDRVWLDQARQQLATQAGPVEIGYLTGLALEDVQQAVATLPAHTVVLVGPFLRDATGHDFATSDAIRRIAAASTVPTYGLTEAALGTGAVGGYVVNYEAHGQAAGDVALRVLAGERPSPTEAGTNVTMVDARQLERWRLDARRLPAGSVVRFRQPSVWEQYRWWVVAAASALLLQSALIGGLFVQRALRRRAQARLAESVEQIQTLAGRLITAQEEERRRIARELHDGINQKLSALSIALTTLGRRAPSRAADLTDALARLQERAAGLVEEIRQLSHELHPGVLQHVGLVAALQAYCEEFEEEYGLAMTFQADGDLGVVPIDRALCLYRATQEALGNVAKHAKARHVRVSVVRDHDGVRLAVADDGCGFDATEARNRGGLGLISLHERVRLVGGQVTIRTDPHAGTEIRILVPLPESPDAPPDGPTR